MIIKKERYLRAGSRTWMRSVWIKRENRLLWDAIEQFSLFVVRCTLRGSRKKTSKANKPNPHEFLLNLIRAKRNNLFIGVIPEKSVIKAKELFQNKLNDYNFTQREKTGDKICSVNLLLTNNCGVSRKNY